MAISYVGGDDTSTAVASTSLTWPTVEADDQALLFWTGQNGISFTGPSGFTLVEAFVADSGTHESRLYRKTAVGNEDATSITLTMGSANKHSACLLVYRGVSTSSPINTHDAVDSNTGTGTHTCPQVTPSVANCAIVVAYSERLSDGTQNITQPTSYTKREQITSQNGGGATFLSTADDGLAVSRSGGVAVNPGNWTGADANSNAVTWSVALAPASQTVAVGQAVETDTANAVAWAPKHRLVRQATETDLAIGPADLVDVGQATETDTAFPVSAVKKPVIQYKIQIDWDADGFMEDDDVTSRTLERGGLTMEYGRDQARSLSPMAAGRASLEISNRSRDYSPDNLASPLYGKLIQARPLRIQAILDPDPLNLNPLFGSDVSDWTASASASIAHSTSVVHPDGNGSMQLTPDGGSAGGAGSGLFAVTGGESYVASMWAYSEEGYDGGVTVLIKWYTTGEVFLSSDQGTLIELPADEWVETGDTFTAPQTAEFAAVWAWQPGTPAGTDVWYAWNVRMSPAYNVSTLFRGHTDEFTVQPMPQDRSVAITGLDAIAMLQGAKVTTELHDSIQTGEAIGYILDALGWPEDKRDLDPGATTVRWWWVEDGDAFEAIEDLVRSEGPGAIVHADAHGRIVFRDRHHRVFSDASRFAQTTLVDSSEDGEPAFSEFDYDHGWRDVVNSVAIQVEELGPSATLETVWESESIVSIGANDTLVRQLTLDNPVINPEASFTTLSGSVSASITVDSGQTITLSLSAGSGGGLVTDLVVLAQPVDTRRSYTVLTEDSASIAAYGLRSQTYDVPWAGVHDAEAIGQLVIDASAQRRPIVTVKLRSGTWTETERLRQQLSRNISDRVHVREPETQVDHGFFIEKISHSMDSAGLLIETTFGMERAILQADNVFRFDDDDHGFNDGVFASVGLTDPETLFRFDTTGQGFDDGVFAT